MFQLGNAFGCHASSLPLAKELVLTSLTLDPHSQLGVGFVVARNDTILVDLLVLQKLVPSFFPNGIVGVPDKANLVQKLDSFIGEGRPLPLQLELVLIALTLYPLSKRSVVFIRVGDVAMAVVTAKIAQIFELFSPNLGCSCKRKGKKSI